MKIAVIAAMGKELRLLLAQMESYKEKEVDGLTIYEGKIGGKDIVLMQCGIGKVNAALRTAALLRTADPDLVINSGVAGGTDISMKIGEVLVADSVAYHDVWCGPGTDYGAADGFPVKFRPWENGMEIMRQEAQTNPSVKFGLLCSGDKFISTPEEVAVIKSHFPEALGCDMESAAIAQTCGMNGVPFMIVRVMSDMPGGEDNISEYNNFWEDAPHHTFEAVSGLIEKL